jgi:hypothetical protein
MSDDSIEAPAPFEVQEPAAVYVPILQPPSHADIRDELEDLVIRDLLGPAGGPDEEVGEDRVRERYLVGMLAPKRQTGSEEAEAPTKGGKKAQSGAEDNINDEGDVDAFDDIGVAGTDSFDEGKADPGVAPPGTMLPSSMGMTFCVDGDAHAFRVTARWGRYSREHSQTATDPKTGNPLLVWKRTQIEVTSDPIPLCGGRIPSWVPCDEQPEVYVEGKIRKSDGDWIVSIFLVNAQAEPAKRKDEAWLFQVELVCSSLEGETIFVKRPFNSGNPNKLDAETLLENESMEMLYRRRVEFAVGHGTSVHADGVTPDGQRASCLRTTTIPKYEVEQQTSRLPEDDPALASLVLDMSDLAQTPDGQFGAKLNAMTDAYAQWIERERAKMGVPAELLQRHQRAADRAIKQCEQTLERIRAGIRLLDGDAMAAEAFRFANRAMALQRVHSMFARAVRRGQRKVEDGFADLDVPRNRSWRPFQLAFILLNLPSVTDLHHPERSHKTDAVADLLWFPTGGGKTEAYLGIAAYVMALRRLQGPVEGRDGEHGIAVLMRYTLRLLTLQQFQRAAALMCAAETIRQADIGKWGEAVFRIGLWVGQKATPNTTQQSQESISGSRGSRGSLGIGTPAQLTSCPWCGSPVEPGKDIKVFAGTDKINRTIMYCGDPLGRCPFSERNALNEGIPALVVDEEIYRHPPTLLIATVDKFAQMPWKGTVQMLFGQVNGYCPRHGFRSPETEDSDSHPRRGSLPAVKSIPCGPLRPPDLIIQDELHLISGPLGSMVGLYETAVDELCSWEVGGNKVRPKVIASTATIRRSEAQVYKIFLRKVNVFPSHGTDVRDNFFAIQRPPGEDHPGRRYVGICAIGRRYPVTLIRVYVALLAAAKKLYEKYDAAADPWMTLAGYFNSIRELGGARRWIDDSVSTRLRNTDERGLARRRSPILEELTSRRSGVDIPRILDRLEIGFSKRDEQRRIQLKKQGLKDEIPEPLDVVLATNMISVGVDVDRLSLMAVAGQPKTTAEYIQATSRVGRQFPGFVVTVFNWARPRDLSHYERFEHYHATFYKQVEALSVTPFAPRALDRGLTGILVALVRLAAEELNKNGQAQKLTYGHRLMANAMAVIVERAELVEGSRSLGKFVQSMIKERNDLWLSRIQNATTNKLGYRQVQDGVTVGLLQPAGDGDWERFTCLNSLRDVEPEVNLILSDDYGMDDSPAPNANQANSGTATI